MGKCKIVMSGGGETKVKNGKIEKYYSKSDIVDSQTFVEVERAKVVQKNTNTTTPMYYSLLLTLRDDLLVLYSTVNYVSKVTPFYYDAGSDSFIEGTSVAITPTITQSAMNPGMSEWTDLIPPRLIKDSDSRFFLCSVSYSWGFQIINDNEIEVLWNGTSLPTEVFGYTIGSDPYAGEVYFTRPESIYSTNIDQYWICDVYKMGENSLYLDRSVTSDVQRRYYKNTSTYSFDIGLQCVFIHSIFGSFTIDTKTGRTYVGIASASYGSMTDGNFLTTDNPSEIIKVRQTSDTTLELRKVTRLQDDSIEVGTAFNVDIEELKRYSSSDIATGSVYGKNTLLFQFGNTQNLPGTTYYTHRITSIIWESDDSFRIVLSKNEEYYAKSHLMSSTNSKIEKPGNKALGVQNVKPVSSITSASIRRLEIDPLDLVQEATSDTLFGLTKAKCSPEKAGEVWVWKGEES